MVHLLKVEPKYIYEKWKKDRTIRCVYDDFFLADGVFLKCISIKIMHEDWPMVNYQIVYDEEKTKPHPQNGFCIYGVG